MPAAPASLKQTGCTGIEDVLLSWLLVLLRVESGESVAFDWAVCGHEDRPDLTRCRTLASKDVMTTSDDELEMVRREIRVKAEADGTVDVQRSDIVLLSTTVQNGSSLKDDSSVAKIRVQLANGGPLEILSSCAVNQYMRSVSDFYINALSAVYEDMCSLSFKTITDVLQINHHDLDVIWEWNAEVPPTYDERMHEIISRVALEMPEKVAVDSWDGCLSYSQIDSASSQLARHLVHRYGVTAKDAVLICFEKSKWTTVATLAVSKAGATIVLADPSLPLPRLQNMAIQTEAMTIVSSKQQACLSHSIIMQGNVVVLDDEAKFDTPTMSLPSVDTDSLMYIVFTSGSTGIPKGVMVSHKSFTSSAYPRAAAVGYTADSRVLDFASYAFDVSIDSIMLTLTNGGTLCIPSDEARLGNLNEVIRQMRINFAALTPSVARLLDDDVLDSLSVLALGGEAASAHDVAVYGQRARVVIGYGPCECTVGCTINSSAANGKPQVSIGKGNGANMWLVDPNDHNVLVPIGAVGELLVEGPIVGQGYLNDPAKTSSVFIRDPGWLIAGHRDRPGRSACLYKTGDLARYDLDCSGEIIFAGRKDTQVKLRGQRIELGEIESQIKSNLPSQYGIVVEVIKPRGQPLLACFVSQTASPKLGSNVLTMCRLSEGAQQQIQQAYTRIIETLPKYMIPSAWVPLESIPALISGKIDRKQLKSFGDTLDTSKLPDFGRTAVMDRPLSEVEVQLRTIWAKLLDVDEATITAASNVLSLGADSLMAMKMVASCHAKGLRISVAKILENPVLSQMASAVEYKNEEPLSVSTPFGMLHSDVDLALDQVSRICGIKKDEVEDIYPCSPVQEALFTYSMRSDDPYIAQRVARIPQDCNIEQWKQAWSSSIAAIPILRTRIVHLEGQSGLHQVLPIARELSWLENTDLDTYLQEDRKRRMMLGDSLCRYAVITHAATKEVFMVWTIHHAAYDGFSEPLIIRQVHQALYSPDLVPTSSTKDMRDFVRWLENSDGAATIEYWKNELDSATGESFPQAPKDHLSRPDQTIERNVSFRLPKAAQVTMSTLIRAAWALISSQYTLTEDIVFGETLVGRDIDLPGVEAIAGPLIATIPTRVHLNYEQTVFEYLRGVTQCHVARIQHQHFGWQNIRKVSRDAQLACETGCGIVIQPQIDDKAVSLGFEAVDVVQEAIKFNPYSLMLAFGLQKDGFRLCANFDSSVIDAPLVDRLLAQFEIVCLRLATSMSARLRDISCLPGTELDAIWKLRRCPPLTEQLQARDGIRPGDPYPPMVQKWICDPRTGQLSPLGAKGEICLECDFITNKSAWQPRWLLCGSPAFPGREGRLHKTGDLVLQQDSGELIFRGRLTQLDRTESAILKISRLVKENLTAPHVLLRKEIAGGTLLVVLVQQTESDGALLASSTNVKKTSSPYHAWSAVSQHVLGMVLQFNKSWRHQISSGVKRPFIAVVNTLPQDDQSQRAVLDDLTEEAMQVMQDDMEQALAQAAGHVMLTPPEQTLRQLWSDILHVPVGEIQLDDNFFRLGGDSILAMKLSSLVRARRFRLTVADIFQNMLLRDAAKAMTPILDTPLGQAAPYMPFSLIRSDDKTEFLTRRIRPLLSEPDCIIEDVVPATDTQVHDIQSTIGMLKTAIEYISLKFDSDLYATHIKDAIKQWTQRHQILRTAFVQSQEQFWQVVLDRGVDIATTECQAGQDIDEFIAGLCNEDADTSLTLGSLFTKVWLISDETHHSLVLRVSHSQYDGVSLPYMLEDLSNLLQGHYFTPSIPFACYVSHIVDPDHRDTARSYWKNLLHASTNTSWPQRVNPNSSIHSTLLELPIPTPKTPEGITEATLLSSAWSLALAKATHCHDVTFGTITSGRDIPIDDAGTIAGPCYTQTPVRVCIGDEWTAVDLMRFVQRQRQESSPHDFLGHESIVKECTDWDVSGLRGPYYGSVTHHIADDGDIDMFGGRKCKVDVVNPHGVPAWPLKIIMFAKNKVARLGVVGPETDKEVLVDVLGKMGEAVRFLTGDEGTLLKDFLAF